LLPFLWLLTGATLIVATAALIKARKLARRLERLTESYWELRYEYGQLRARLNRLDPEPPAAATAEPSRQSGVTFVPISSLKR
jgi:hypothetical protein